MNPNKKRYPNCLFVEEFEETLKVAQDIFLSSRLISKIKGRKISRIGNELIVKFDHKGEHPRTECLFLSVGKSGNGMLGVMITHDLGLEYASRESVSFLSSLSKGVSPLDALREFCSQNEVNYFYKGNRTVGGIGSGW